MRCALLGLLPAASALSVGRSKNALNQALPMDPDSPLLQPEVERDGPTTPIPKVIHFMFKQNRSVTEGNWPNQVWQASFEAWQKYFPEGEYTYKWWSDQDLAAQFDDHCPEWKEWWHKVPFPNDLSRYCILDQFGGIYSDLDYEPRANFYSDLLPGKISLLENWKSGNRVGETPLYTNILMASPPGEVSEDVHKYWRALLDLSRSRKGAWKNFHLPPAYITGPWLLDHVDRQADESLNKKLPSLLHKLPCQQFYKIGWEMGWKSNAKEGCNGLNSTTIEHVKGVHWSTMTWWAPGTGQNVNVMQNEEPFKRLDKTFWAKEQEKENLTNVSHTPQGKNLKRTTNHESSNAEEMQVARSMWELFMNVHDVKSA